MASLVAVERTAQLRELFPHLDERVYLDTAAAGLCWKGHGAAVARFYDEVKNRGYDARPEWWAMIAKVRSRLAQWLGVTAQDITFVSNTTEGLNLAANSLEFRSGDRIVCAQDEFPSVIRIWNKAEREGAELVAVPIAHESERQARLMEATDAGARVLVVSQTHSGTGTTLDLGVLGRHCRERGTLLMVDGIQALGAVPTQLDEVDIYASSFFKWMLSGFGIGMLVTSARAREAMAPAWQGYANMDDSHQLQYAHVNTPALYGLDSTLELLEGIGWDTIHARVRALGQELIAQSDRLGLDLVTPRDQHAGIFVFRAPDGEATRLRLAERNISVSARGEGVRVSPHFYNSTQDVEHCATALAEVLATT
ncbi:aminotransferase class V-fold PLP-dependent enzyme [Variovorax sp. Sphag1AA]|uniref:aminotransferase class V-fold PLP-dependent enzyme n=1 Tax=Variovorax sp. Sphag1AA TaxID=2587027 RepID=UPI001611CFBD|nr:aminotransferase class V-fold PLP-dependent enzyme [Variovorax sp. Sphag1AA]MBB3178194.1 selenocysteine lyase/cysteine desulfurase [Variovorax sp. Sphag1AA]